MAFQRLSREGFSLEVSTTTVPLSNWTITRLIQFCVYLPWCFCSGTLTSYSPHALRMLPGKAGMIVSRSHRTVRMSRIKARGSR